MINRFSVVVILQLCTVLVLVAKGLTFITEPFAFDVVFSSPNRIGSVLGSVLIIVGLLHLLPHRSVKNQYSAFTLILASLILGFHSYCGYVKVGFVLEQLVEHSLQMFLPLVYMRALTLNSRGIKKCVFELKVLVLLTFVGHAFFALGYHFIPENFIEMTTEILGVNSGGAITFLFVVGLLDIICAIGLFIPRMRNYTTYYLVIWGIITALARLWYGLSIGASSYEILFAYLPNTLYRLPHGLIPMLLLLHITKTSTLTPTPLSFR